MDAKCYIMYGVNISMDAYMVPESIARHLPRGYRGADGMDSHDITTLRPVEELIEAYPDGVAEVATPGIAYGDLAQEAASTVALGTRKPVRDRCIACGLREQAFSELAAAHHDFVSAQAHFDAARARSRPDEASKQRRADLASLRREMIAQAAFYLTTLADSERLARVRKRGDLVADVRALVQLIRPRRTLILDPSFKEEWLHDALALAEAEEKARAARAVEAAMKRRRVQLRLVRDRTVARVVELLGEIRMYGRHAFRDDPKLWAAFGSNYLRQKRKRRKKRQGGGDRS
jgi:hypothetical protein